MLLGCSCQRRATEEEEEQEEEEEEEGGCHGYGLIDTEDEGETPRRMRESLPDPTLKTWHVINIISCMLILQPVQIIKDHAQPASPPAARNQHF